MSRMEQLRKLHDTDPNDADVAYMLAQEHAKAGDHAGAVEWFDRCLALSGAYSYAYFHKARALEAMGRVTEARATLGAGLAAAQGADDAKAAGEIAAYLDSL